MKPLNAMRIELKNKKPYQDGTTVVKCKLCGRTLLEVTGEQYTIIKKCPKCKTWCVITMGHEE